MCLVFRKNEGVKGGEEGKGGIGKEGKEEAM